MRGAKCARRRRRQRRRRWRLPRSTMDCAETSSRITFTFFPLDFSFIFFLLLLYSLYLRIFSRLSPLFIITYLFHLTYTRYRFSHVPPRLFYHVPQSQLSRYYFFLDSFLFPYPRYPYRFAPLFLLLPDNSIKSRAYRK